MFFTFPISSSQCATKGTAERSNYTFLVAQPAHILLIAIPALPKQILFWFVQTIKFFPVYLFYIFEFENA